MCIKEFLLETVFLKGLHLHYSIDGGGDDGDARDITIEGGESESVFFKDVYADQYEKLRQFIFSDLCSEVGFDGSHSVSGEGTLELKDGYLVNEASYYYTNYETKTETFHLNDYTPEGVCFEQLSLLHLFSISCIQFQFDSEGDEQHISHDGDEFNLNDYVVLRDSFNKLFEFGDFKELVGEVVATGDYKVSFYFRDVWKFDIEFDEEIEEDTQIYKSHHHVKDLIIKDDDMPQLVA